MLCKVMFLVCHDIEVFDFRSSNNVITSASKTMMDWESFSFDKGEAVSVEAYKFDFSKIN